MLLSYIENLYKDSTTQLRIENKLLPQMKINKGIW